MSLQPLPLRLPPGADLRLALRAVLDEHGVEAAFVVSGIGSLSAASLRLAGAQEAIRLEGDLEILTLAGTVSVDGVHLHASVADARGQVTGGHVAAGCTVRTTAEVLVVLLPAWRFERSPDTLTGYAELSILRR